MLNRRWYRQYKKPSIIRYSLVAQQLLRSLLQFFSFKKIMERRTAEHQTKMKR